MLSGLNTDTPYQGETYHIQTEDGGHRNPVITTHVFVKGAVQFSKKTSYADIIKAESLNDILRDLMNQQHHTTIKALLSGVLMERKLKAGGPVPVETAVQSQSTPVSQPRPKGPKKGLDEMISDYLADKERRGAP